MSIDTSSAYYAELYLTPEMKAAGLVQHLSKRADNRITSHPFDFAERYKKGEGNVVVKLRSRSSGSEYDLVFFRVPLGGEKTTATRNHEVVISNLLGCHANGNNESVITLPANSVECPNCVIPSLVRFEASKERQDFRREIFHLSGFQQFFELNGVVRDGKVNEVRSLSAASNCHSVSGLVQTRSERLDGVIGKVSDFLGDGFSQFELVNLIARIRICLDYASVGFFLEELVESSIDVLGVFLCATKSALGTFKGTGHVEDSKKT